MGGRDSEVAVVLEDLQTVSSSMNGHPYSAGEFCHSLRTRLWAEHLGLQPDDERLLDPVAPQVSPTASRSSSTDLSNTHPWHGRTPLTIARCMNYLPDVGAAAPQCQPEQCHLPAHVPAGAAVGWCAFAGHAQAASASRHGASQLRRHTTPRCVEALRTVGHRKDRLEWKG